MSAVQLMLSLLLIFTVFKLAGLFTLSKLMKPSQEEIEAAKQRRQEEVDKTNKKEDEESDNSLF